ncbi:MAG: L,D-transpeptidase [Duncaniella sp.]|nr:L,D-transpeptidase [Duncaniella sp.]
MKKILTAIALLIISVAASRAADRIVIDKPSLMLYVISEKADTLFRAPVCVGKNLGDKQRKGDMRTPEGTFSITQIQDASTWTHDFNDGAGERKGAYGPYFFRLATPPHTGIGIHGTCFPERISTRDSEGCIRLLDDDLRRLRPYVFKGMEVKITPDKR